MYKLKILLHSLKHNRFNCTTKQVQVLLLQQIFVLFSITQALSLLLLFIDVDCIINDTLRQSVPCVFQALLQISNISNWRLTVRYITDRQTTETWVAIRHIYPMHTMRRKNWSTFVGTTVTWKRCAFFGTQCSSFLMKSWRCLCLLRCFQSNKCYCCYICLIIFRIRHCQAKCILATSMCVSVPHRIELSTRHWLL